MTYSRWMYCPKMIEKKPSPVKTFEGQVTCTFGWMKWPITTNLKSMVY